MKNNKPHHFTQERLDRVLNIIKNNGPTDYNVIANKMNSTPDRIRKCIVELRKRGLIESYSKDPRKKVSRKNHLLHEAIK